MAIPVQMKESNVDVLVIGAGPAGVMCAHALARAGVNVRIIDQRPGKVAAGQADGIQPRTIEVFQSYGLADRLLREGNQMHRVAFYNPRADGGIERTSHAQDVMAPTARFPFEVTLHQGAIEAIFLDSMREMGVQVDRPIIPTSIQLSTDESELKDINAHPVKVVLKRLEGEETDTELVHAKFVVGCDGAHSWVRKSLGISMDGEQTKYIWGVVDMVPDTDFPDIRNRCAIHSDHGSGMVIPREGDLVRLYLQLSQEDVIDPVTQRVDKNRMGPEQLLEVAKKLYYPYTMSTKGAVDWWTIYIIGQRVASQFSVNERVFIAGDACHTHSPKAGQGMNASMNDTHNLSWKLAQVLRGWADISLLKTYEFERRKYAQDLINFDKKYSALFSGKPRTEANQDGVSHEQFLEAFQTFGAFMSGTGVHYLPSTIVNTKHQAAAAKLIIGQRFLPHVFICAANARPHNIHDLLPADARFKVVIFAGDTSDAQQAERLRVLAAEVDKPTSFYQRFGRERSGAVFDVISISSATKERYDANDVPALFKPHWTKVLLDDTDMYQRSGGGGYAAYGVDPARGAVVVVRPDGYVGTVAPYEDIQDINDYFASFLKV